MSTLSSNSVKDNFSFGFAEFLQDDLFGCLSGNSAQMSNLVVLFDCLADFGLWVLLFGFFQANLQVAVFDFVDDIVDNIDVDIATVDVDCCSDILVALAVVAPLGGGYCLLDNFVDGFGGDVLFFGQSVADHHHLFKINIHC